MTPTAANGVRVWVQYTDKNVGVCNFPDAHYWTWEFRSVNLLRLWEDDSEGSLIADFPADVVICVEEIKVGDSNEDLRSVQQGSTPIELGSVGSPGGRAGLVVDQGLS